MRGEGGLRKRRRKKQGIKGPKEGKEKNRVKGTRGSKGLEEAKDQEDSKDVWNGVDRDTGMQEDRVLQEQQNKEFECYMLSITSKKPGNDYRVFFCLKYLWARCTGL